MKNKSYKELAIEAIVALKMQAWKLEQELKRVNKALGEDTK